MKTFITIATVLALGGAAHAADIQLERSDDNVVVVVSGAAATTDTIRTRGDKIDITLESSVGRQRLEIDDATIRRIDLYPGRKPMLSIKLRDGRTFTKLALRTATIENTGDAIRLTIPRDPRSIIAAEEAAAKAAAEAEAAARAALDAAAKAAAEADARARADAAAAAAAAATAATEADTTTETEDALPASVTGATTNAPADAPRIGGASDDDTGAAGLGRSVLVALFLAGAGALVYLRKYKRKNATISADALEVIARKSLGPKSQVVLLSAGDRELLVGLGDKGPQLLATWKARAGKRTDPAEALEAIDAIDNFDELPTPSAAESRPFAELAKAAAKKWDTLSNAVPRPIAAEPTPVVTPMGTARTELSDNPAIAGILKLRADLPPVNDAVATDDEEADAIWARELFLATRQRGYGS